jgi:cell division protein FtsB
MDQPNKSRFAIFGVVAGFIRRIKWPVLAIIMLYMYLAFHAFSGSQGLFNWVTSDNQAQILQVRLDGLTTQKLALEAEVEALDTESLDVDALDRISREKLFYSDTKDLTIWLDPSD